ncbi:hypothetical protein [Thiofilum flexile]|uniref:hypothetical protein n=1 Tax=Thiofilum flexile TaxID=125627 RepID=UPI000382253C|nr:hypothetical protein [Thiofilum flexile]
MSTQPTEKSTQPANGSLATQEGSFSMQRFLKRDALFFGGIIFLALLGIGITNYNGEKSYTYWTYMLVITAIVTTIWGWRKGEHTGFKNNSKFLLQQVTLWGAAFIALLVIYLFLESGRLNYETTGLMILLLLALVTFIDGILVSWELYIVGLLLLLSLLTVTYMQKFLWIIILIAIIGGGLALAFMMLKRKIDKPSAT